MGIFSEQRRTKGQRPVTTLIAEGCAISGQFKVENNIQVDGSVDGQIYVDKTMVISEGGIAKGEIYAEHLIVNGAFEGTCYATTIEILSKGNVKGTLYSDNLSIEQGGHFNGATQPAPEQQVVDFKEAKTAEEAAAPKTLTKTKKSQASE